MIPSCPHTRQGDRGYLYNGKAYCFDCYAKFLKNFGRPKRGGVKKVVITEDEKE